MKLSQTRGNGAPPAAERFWKAVDETPPSPDCENCTETVTCGGCKHDAVRCLANAERFA